MEVIYPKACGVDVHKSFIVAVICDSTSVKPQYLRKRFSTFNNSLIEFRNWLLANDCHNVCMESTGKYYVPVYNALEGHISNVVVANPKWVACIKGEKDDNKDAKWIADLFKLGIVRSSFIPNKDIRILRELTRYLYKLTNMRSSEKNRFINALTVGNCKLDMVFSDIFGKTSSAIIDTILSQNEYNDEEILKNVDWRCKSSNEDILNSISGISWEDSQKQRMNVIQEHIDYLDKSIKTIREIINTIITPYESAVNLLCSIPGIKRNSAITIISEIGTDMSQFSSHYRLASWAGLAPGCNESAGKKKSVKISRAGVYLKPALVEVAHNAVKDKNNPYFANKFNVISKRRGKKRAYIAIARKILVAIYHMLSTGELFNPSDASKVETTNKDKIKFTKNNFIQSTKQLLSLGLTVDELQTFITSKISDLTPIT
jgi:transposase